MSEKYRSYVSHICVEEGLIELFLNDNSIITKNQITSIRL